MEQERNMIGERMRHARKSAGMTLGELSEALADVGESITKAGLSKYELGKSVPKASFLKSLGQALELPSEYFLMESKASIRWRLFRKKSKFSLSKQDAIKAQATDMIESQIWLETTLNDRINIRFPPVEIAQSLDDAERAADRARKHWGLKNLPVENLMSLLESCGCIVVAIEDSEVQFDGLSGWITTSNTAIERPLIIINTYVSTDRVRYNIAHELGHLLLGDPSIKESEEEKFAHRFAAAFLAPREAVLRELGEKRRNLIIEELGLLKRKYGFSMQGWIRRAFDLSIIPKSRYQSLFRQFSKRGWRKSEPVSYEGYEIPTRYRQLFLRAQAENIVTEGRTHLVMPKEFQSRPEVSKARKFLEMSPERRTTLLESLAESAAGIYDSDYLADFEDLGVDDFYNYAD